MKKFLVLISVLFLQLFIVNPCFAIKIGLQTGVDRAYIGASTAAQIINVHTNRQIYRMDKMVGYEFRAYHNSIAIKIKGQYYNLASDSVTMKPASGGFISVKGRWYRGSFIVNNHNGELTVINKLDIDNYIRGVVP